MTPRKSWKLGPSPLGEGPGNGLGELVRGPAVSRSRADSSALRTGGAALAGGVPEFGRAPGGRRAGHSFSPSGVPATPSGPWRGSMALSSKMASFGWALGSASRTLGQLAAQGLALANQGDIDRQVSPAPWPRAPMARAGPCRPLRPWSRACVWWMGEGRIHVLTGPEILDGTRIHLGLLGVVMALALRLRPATGSPSAMPRSPLRPF